MFFFNMTLLPFFIIGLAWVLFAGPIINFGLRNRHGTVFDRPHIKKLFLIWPIRILGIAGIVFAVFLSINRPDREMMKKDENRVALLEQGKIVEGKVLDRWYDDWAPSSWMILYSFDAPNPANSKLKTYYGSARGPKHYYSTLSKKDTVAIIYDPAKPKINSEIYEFLNFPGYRRTFRLAGKLELLNKFQDKYKYKDTFENYSYMTWYDEARLK